MHKEMEEDTLKKNIKLGDLNRARKSLKTQPKGNPRLENHSIWNKTFSELKDSLEVAGTNVSGPKVGSETDVQPEREWEGRGEKCARSLRTSNRWAREALKWREMGAAENLPMWSELETHRFEALSKSSAGGWTQREPYPRRTVVKLLKNRDEKETLKEGRKTTARC